MKTLQLDIITPTSIESFVNVTYLRMPGLDGLVGVQARHANAIIGLGVGEIKVNQNGKEKIFSTSGGFADIQPESVQLLLETIESKNRIDKKRAEAALNRAQTRIKDKTKDFERASQSLARAKNRIKLLNK
tara:strand:+ start:102 stop:494 length:393 start_codon:yes stop_codon:yes gene_type:complete